MCLINRTSIDTDKNNICYIVDSILSEDFSIWDQHPGFYKGSMGWVNLIEFQDIDSFRRFRGEYFGRETSEQFHVIPI